MLKIWLVSSTRVFRITSPSIHFIASMQYASMQYASMHPCKVKLQITNNYMTRHALSHYVPPHTHRVVRDRTTSPTMNMTTLPAVCVWMLDLRCSHTPSNRPYRIWPGPDPGPGSLALPHWHSHRQHFTAHTPMPKATYLLPHLTTRT
jgi:hypothetical protein